jgi:hypothetical protein
MEYFLCVSFIGTLALLTAHTVDYALDALRRPLAATFVAMPDEDGPIGDVLVPVQAVEEYERAA